MELLHRGSYAQGAEKIGSTTIREIRKQRRTTPTQIYRRVAHEDGEVGGARADPRRRGGDER